MTEMKLVHVPLQQLHVSGQNVRKVAPDPDKLRELTASIDALGLLASGALLFSAAPEEAGRAAAALRETGIPAAVIGAAHGGSGVTLRTASGSRPLPAYPVDEIYRVGSEVP